MTDGGGDMYCVAEIEKKCQHYQIFGTAAEITIRITEFDPEEYHVIEHTLRLGEIYRKDFPNKTVLVSFDMNGITIKTNDILNERNFV